MKLYTINDLCTYYNVKDTDISVLKPSFDEKLRSLTEKGFTDVLNINCDYRDEDDEEGKDTVIGPMQYLGKVYKSVPAGMLEMFKKLFKDHQKFLCEEMEDIVKQQDDVFADFDKFAEFHQSYLSPYVCVHESKFDENKLNFDYTELNKNDTIEKLGLDLLTSSDKKDFWSDDFEKKNKGMRYIKMAVKNALNDFQKKGIPMECIENVFIECRACLMMDLDRVSNYKVFVGISPNSKMTDGQKEEYLVPGKYTVIYSLMADYRKNPLCLSALRIRKMAEIKSSSLDDAERERLCSILEDTKLSYPLREEDGVPKEITDKYLIAEDEKRWKTNK